MATMRFVAMVLLAAVVTVFAACTEATAQPSVPEIPPDIKAIMEKAESGKTLTMAEIKKLQEWAMKATGGGMPSGGPAGATGADVDAPSTASMCDGRRRSRGSFATTSRSRRC